MTDILVSTTLPAAAEAQTLILSTAQTTVEEFLEALATKAPNKLDTITQLSSSSPEVAAFVLALEKSIFNAKAVTSQGLFLATGLSAGELTQVQFETAIQGITLSGTQLLAATAPLLVQQTQSLIATLVNSPNLAQLKKLIAAAEAAAVISLTRLNGAKYGEVNPKNTIVEIPRLNGAKDGEVNPKNTIVKPPRLNGAKDGEVNPIDPAHIPYAKTDQTDKKLGNTVDFLTNIINVAAKIAAQNLAASAASLISLKPQPRIMTGARAVLRINNQVVALCTNIQYEVSTEWQEIRGIDELLPNDLAPTSYSVKGSMSIYRVPNRSPVSNFTQQDMFRGIIWPLTTIEIRDKRTDELIMLVRRAAITSRAESFAKNQLTSTNLSFVGIGFRDEAAPEVLPDALTGASTGVQDKLDTSMMFDAFPSTNNIV